MLNTFGVGFISGLRSVLGTTLVSNHLAQRRQRHIEGTPLRHIAAPRAATVFKALTAGELVADKLPWLPDRTDPLPLAGRMMFGALAGATLHGARGRSPLAGAALGAAGAVVGAYVGYTVRTALIERAGLPNPVAGMLGDVAALGLGRTLLHRNSH